MHPSAARSTIFLARMAISSILLSQPRRFLQSADLQEASCVIADVQMPGMSGLDLLKHMHIHCHDVPFILITAFPNEGLRARALQAGAICFLTKPFAVLELIDCVKTALS